MYNLLDNLEFNEFVKNNQIISKKSRSGYLEFM